MSSNGTSCVAYSIPRAGTHALMKTLSLIGLKEFEPKNGIGVFNMNTMPSKGCFEYGGHFVPDMEPIAIMKEMGYKGVFISRDLRDVIVSHAHFGIADSKRQGKHPIYPMFDTHDLNKVISWLIDYEPYRYYCRIGWRNIDCVYSLTYENLWNNTYETIKSISEFLDIKLNNEQLTDCVDKFPPHKNNDNYGLYFRQGKSGDWKNYFTEEHKNKFKKLAGNILIDEGYEINNDW